MTVMSAENNFIPTLPNACRNAINLDMLPCSDPKDADKIIMQVAYMYLPTCPSEK